MPDPPYSLGTIKTPHGKIRTPALIPVVATSYGIWDKWIEGWHPAPWDIAQGSLLSLYHILPYKRKDDVFSKGIHEVLGTDKPVWMDSGGFQYMKKGIELDPQDVVSYQKRSGCDISVTFDYPITPSISDDEKQVRLQKSIDAANNSLDESGSMMMYGAIHGSSPQEMKEYISSLDRGFSGYGIGSLVPRKNNYQHLTSIIKTVRDSTSLPIHAFGITGFPALYALAYLGVDTFDSWTYIVAAAYKEYIDPTTLRRVKKSRISQNFPTATVKYAVNTGLSTMLIPPANLRCSFPCTICTSLSMRREI